MSTKHKLFFGAGLLIVLIAVGVWLFLKQSGTEETVNVNSYTQEVSMGDPIDIVLDFYTPWLDAVRSTSTDPYTSGFVTEKILSEGLRARLTSTAGHAETEIDPVLCQTTVPGRVTGRIVSAQEDTMRVLVLAKEEELTAQSVFTLKRFNGGWFIEDISCAQGEFAPEREFSFDREGFLLKNVPPPLDSKYWYIVFEENKELGHYAPLLFDQKSTCVALDGKESICAPDQLTDTSKVRISGQMLESGVVVIRMKYIE